MRSNNFFAEVLELVKKIPEGKISTYKLVAAQLGYKSSIAARAVGRALHKNFRPINVPCHRVVKSNGEVGGYSLGVIKKVALLKSEGINVVGFKIAEKDRLSKLFSF